MTNEIAAERLKAFIDRVERMEEEKASIIEDIKEIYAEAKGTGFEPKILKMIVKLRKKTKEQRQEEEELLALYMNAVEGIDA